MKESTSDTKIPSVRATKCLRNPTESKPEGGTGLTNPSPSAQVGKIGNAAPLLPND